MLESRFLFQKLLTYEGRNVTSLFAKLRLDLLRLLSFILTADDNRCLQEPKHHGELFDQLARHVLPDIK